MKPPLGLHVEVVAADNTTFRWDSGDRNAGNRPQNLSFSTKRGDGFATGGVTLARRIDLDYPDLNLFDSVSFVGDDGSVAYEGQVGAMPRTVGDSHSIAVTLAGWMAHAKDRKFSEIYVDRALGNWAEISMARQAALLSGAWNPSPTVGEPPDDGNGRGFLLTTEGPLNKPHFNRLYDAGPDAKVARVVAQFALVGFGSGDANLQARAESWSDDNAGGLIASAELKASTVWDFTPATAQRYLNLTVNWAGTAGGTSGTSYGGRWTNVAVMGAHGLQGYGSPEGYVASDVIKNLVRRFCPLLRTDGVQATTFPIPQLAFRDPTFPYDAFLEVNKYHLWELGVWENRTLTFAPAELADYDWEVRIGDGAQFDAQGDEIGDLYNGITVTYDDVQKGAKNYLTPAANPELRDTNLDNPVNTHGRTRWAELELSSPTTRDAALQTGRAALAEANSPKQPGTITILGHIRDRAGHWQQGWKVRAGDTIVVADHPNDRPRLISETTWDHDAKRLTIAVEGPMRRVDAILDRFGVALQAANLT